MYELNTSMYAGVIERDSCDVCRGSLSCSTPYALTTEGLSTSRLDDPSVVVAWPACPHNWRRLRRIGCDALPLSHVVAWHYELGHHKRCGSGGARLYREWLRQRDLPPKLIEARAAAKARLNKQ